MKPTSHVKNNRKGIRFEAVTAAEIFEALTVFFSYLYLFSHLLINTSCILAGQNNGHCSGFDGQVSHDGAKNE